MFIITTIEYVAIAMVGFYLIGLAVVWIYELKRTALYRNMRQQIRNLENFRFSMAVLNAKTYWIMENYRRDITGIEKAQHYLYENWLFFSRRNQRNLPVCGVISMSAGK